MSELDRLRMERDILGMRNAAVMTPEEIAVDRRRLREIEARIYVLSDAERIADRWRALTDSQRHDLIGMCCRGCGSLDTGCQCWNDD